MAPSSMKSALGGIGFVPVLLAAIFAAMLLVEPRFFSRLNTLDMMRNFSFVSLVAIGQALVMIVGGFDLSVAAVIALSSIVSAKTMGALAAATGLDPGMVVAIGCAASIGSGALVGLINGLLVVYLKAAAFMITLGTATALTGLIFFWTNGAPIYGLPDVFTSDFARGQLFRMPYMFLIALSLIAAVWIVMGLTPMGRHVYAVGASPASARVAGISDTRIKCAVYAVSGMLAAIVGLLLTARIGSGQSDLNAQAAMQSIAAAVVGGVSLRGGIGKPWRVALGALLIVIVSNALNLARIDSRYAALVLGLVLLGAALIEVRMRKDGHDE